MLVAITGAMVAFFGGGLRFKRTAEIRLETHQALLASLDSIVREIRLAGACFPATGQFVALAGANTGTRDSITLRLGITANQTCVQTPLSADAPQGTTTLSVTSADGFPVGTAGYITDGASGDFFTVRSVAGNTLTTGTAWTRPYLSASSSVYAMQERVYAIDASGVTPVLTLARDRQTPAQVFAAGITTLDIQYRRADASVTNLPANDADWRLVNEVLVSMVARSREPLFGGDFHQESASVGVKPRNLLP